MTITINGTTGITTPEITLDNTAADGGQVVLKSSGYSDWNLDNYSGRLRGYYGSTEYWTVTASGNVGIGTSSPATKLEVAVSSNSALAGITVTNDNAGSSAASRIIFENDTDSGAGIIRASSANATFGANALTLYQNLSAPVTFWTNNTERMRIDSSGNLLVAKTAQISNERFGVGSGSNVTTAWFQQDTNTSGYNGIVVGLGSNGNNTSSSFLRGNTNTVGNWYLYGNGTMSFSSDERLKKNIETTRDGYIDDVMKLRVVKYNWKKDEDGTPKELGLIAQEVEQVFAGLVQDDLNPVSEDDATVYKQVKQSVLPFILLKAIQEQQAIIESLKTRIETLENK